MLHQVILCTKKEAGVRGGAHARILPNREGYQLECDRPLKGGGGGMAAFSVAYFLNGP